MKKTTWKEAHCFVGPGRPQCCHLIQTGSEYSCGKPTERHHLLSLDEYGCGDNCPGIKNLEKLESNILRLYEMIADQGIKVEGL